MNIIEIERHVNRCGGCYITIRGAQLPACGDRNGALWWAPERRGRRHFGGVQPRYITWSMGCCALESGDAVRGDPD
jgi:hypothetical protein